MRNTIKIELEGSTYEVKFPNVGQMIDIENLKQLLSENTYQSLLYSNVKSAFVACKLIEAIAIFRTLVPDLAKDLKVAKYTDIDPFVAKKILNCYIKTIEPWYNEILSELYADIEENQVPEKIKDEELREDI